MKTPKSTSISKLVLRFDSELKNLIMQDLRSINRTKNVVIDKITNSVKANHLSIA